MVLQDSILDGVCTGRKEPMVKALLHEDVYRKVQRLTKMNVAVGGSYLVVSKTYKSCPRCHHIGRVKDVAKNGPRI